MAGQKQEPSKKLDVTTAATWVPRHDLNSALHKHVAERFSDSVKVNSLYHCRFSFAPSTAHVRRSTQIC